METPKNRTGRVPLTEGPGATASHRIHFRRPETPYSLSKMTASSQHEALLQIRRLKALGYTITEVIPPLEGEAPAGS
jgi:hypothetical protein